MNKKFSTLLAGAALLGAVTANAGGPVKTVAADGYIRWRLMSLGQLLAQTRSLQWTRTASFFR